MSYKNSYTTSRMTRPLSSRTYRAPAHRTGTAPGKRTSILLVIVVLACLALAGWYATTSLGSLISGAQGTPAKTTEPQSTPKNEWRLGEVPSLYQRDPAWATTTYAGDTFAESGCGPTCLSMVYIALTGRDDRTPSDLGALSEQMGSASSDGTAWVFMTEGAASLGLSARELPADEASIRQALLGGSPVICSVGPGDFTSTGHFIVLTGIDEQGRLLIRDPNSPERTHRAWDFDTVLNQSRAIWAYSAA